MVMWELKVGRNILSFFSKADCRVGVDIFENQMEKRVLVRRNTDKGYGEWKGTASMLSLGKKKK